MLFRSSAHMLLWAFGIFVLAVLITLAIDIGLFDAVFGTATQGWLHKSLKVLRDHYGVNSASVDTALKVVGLGFTAIFGMLAFLKGWHYAEINLPSRLVELIDRIKSDHLQDRAVFLSPYSSRNLRAESAPSAHQGLLHRFLNIFRADPTQKSLQRLLGSVDSLDRDTQVLTAKLEVCKAQRITAHLLRGSQLAAEARSKAQDSAAQFSQNEAAMAEFEKALELNGNDLDALEHAARQAKFMNSRVSMLRDLVTMERAAQDQKRPARHARALRFQAEIMEERSNKKALKDARIKLDSALKALDAKDAPDTGTEKPFELALVNEQLGSLHLRRKTLTLVGGHLDDAEQLYKKLPAPEGPAGMLRIEKLRALLSRAQQGGDDPDDEETGDGGNTAS